MRGGTGPGPMPDGGSQIRNLRSAIRDHPPQGRAAEALGRKDEARAHYETAARYSTAYYGQIARARLGHKDLVLRAAPAHALEVVSHQRHGVDGVAELRAHQRVLGQDLQQGVVALQVLFGQGDGPEVLV